MSHTPISVSRMDVLHTGYLRRTDIREPTYLYTLRDWGLLECHTTKFKLSLERSTVVKREADRTLVITDANNYSVMLRAETPASYAAWASALASAMPSSDFKLSRQLIHRSDSSIVFHGVSVRDAAPVAIKAVSRRKRPVAALVESQMSKFLTRESRTVNYPPGLVRCFATYHTKNETHSVMEEAGPTLQAWIDENRAVLSESMAKNVAASLLGAIDFLHAHGIVHGGMCAEHVLVRGFIECDLDVQLAGFSRAFLRNETGWMPKRDPVNITTGMRGVYVAPELLSRGEISPAVDFWSLGVLMYFVMVGKLPFWRHGDTEEDAMQRMLDYADVNRIDFRKSREILFPEGDDVIATLSDDAMSFLSMLLTPDAAERTGNRPINRHPWMLLARIPAKMYADSQSPVDVFAKGYTG